MKKTDLAYIAGIVDGEGCIQINYRQQCHSYDCQVSVVNTKQWLIEWLKFSFGGRTVTVKRKETEGNKKDCFRWYARTYEALPFLESIYPYLRLKKPQAEIAIKFLKVRKDRKAGEKPGRGRVMAEAEKILFQSQADEMAKLNKRGKVQINIRRKS